MSKVIQLVDYTPNEKQAAVHADEARFQLLLGGWRAGKTHCMAWEIVHRALRVTNRAGSGALFGVFRRTGPALTDHTQRDVLGIVPTQFMSEIRRQEGRAECTIAGVRVLFRSLDDWKKLGGASFDGIFVDEAWEFSLGDFEMMRGRLSGRYGPRRMMLCTNPPTRNHWLYKLFVEAPQDGYHVHHFSTFDNTENLPADYIEECRTLEKTDPQKYRRFVLGDWGFTSDSPPCFKGVWSDEENTGLLEPVKGVGLYLLSGWDFGWHHPAVVWVQVLPNGHVNLLREHMGEDIDLASFARQYIQQSEVHFPGFDVIHYCDPTGKQRNDMGSSSVRELVKQDIHPRYRKIRQWRRLECMRDIIGRTSQGRRVFKADRRYAKFFIEGCQGGYVMDPDTDLPEDNFYKHLQDAGQYAISPTLLAPHMPKEERARPPSRQRVAV